MIEQIILMCAIVGLSPVEVDCDTKWVLLQDTELMVNTPTHGWVSGIAMYDFKKYPISEFYPELNGTDFENYRYMTVSKIQQDYCWNDVMTDEPVNCIPIIWHEIKHQVCTCNWHKDLVRTFKSFSNVFGGI